MNEEHKEKIKRIADLTREQIGDSEESVKINFIVPLLEALGHDRLDFEYKYKDICVRKGLPQFAKLIIETKSYDKDLTLHLQQLENYCHEDRPLLGIIANGTDIRIYSYWWKYRASFQEHLIYLINRRELKDEQTIKVIENILSRESLKNGDARECVNQREEEIKLAESKIRSIEEKIKDDEDKLKAKIRAYEEKIDEIRTSISNVHQELVSVQSQKREQLAVVRSDLGLPEPDVPRQRTATETRAPEFKGAEGGGRSKTHKPSMDDRTLELVRDNPHMFSEEQIWQIICEEYADDKHPAETLKNTTRRRLNGHLNKTKGVRIKKDAAGKYYIE